MFENNTNTYTHTSGKQRVVIPQKHKGNMYAFTLGGTKRKHRVIKRGK